MSTARTAENAHALALRTKNVSPAMWEALARLDATPEDIVAKLPQMCVMETAVEIAKARERIAADEREIRRRLRHAQPVIETRAERIVNDQLRSVWKSSSSARIGRDDGSETALNGLVETVAGAADRMLS